MQCVIDFVQLFEFLSTPSSRRATQAEGAGGTRPTISIHALLAEGDHRLWIINPVRYRFLSTPSSRRATEVCLWYTRCAKISIHALLAEGDISFCIAHLQIWLFLSTPSSRRATLCRRSLWRRLGHFYPRPPRGGRPTDPQQLYNTYGGFLSTPSARRATLAP